MNLHMFEHYLFRRFRKIAKGDC